MKKTFLFIATAIVTTLIIISSCKKGTSPQLNNWLCHCTMTNSSGTYSLDISEQELSQDAATSACAQQQVNHTSATTSAACQLHQQ